MKKTIFLFLLFLPCSFLLGAQSWPSPTGYVNDFAHVIPADQSQAMENLLTELEQKTTAQVAVATVPSVEGADIDGAAVELFKAWGIGKKGKDNGILILVSIQDRKDRIEVGYGLESVITDGQTGVIRRRDMEPFFKQGGFGQGITNGVNSVAQLIAANAGVALNGQVRVRAARSRQGGLGFWGTIVLFIFIYLIFSQLGRRGRGGYSGGGFYGGGWGSGGGGFGGGGFGGFGGGGSGGGGSSGSW